ncbi:MAG TPA: phenylalanine--tRNA ligase subunit beta, partial [Candidatus Hydrogenedentes bacterium]|nr:phenylalanine--tRNA ligase subunit beta [Candidatus Hydrogenedentota bacterium]
MDAMTLAEHLTMLGLEIEAIERPGAEISEVYIGQILSIEPHPDADKLVVCHTDIGREDPLQIICGATNMKVGDKVPTAVVGATLPGGFAITRRKMRGIESFGMMCSPKELGLGEDHQGLMILDPETPVGADAKTALGLDDVILEIEVTPNRGDWDCMIGVARELAAFYNTPCRIPVLRLDETGEAATALSSVTIEDPEKCPRYIGRVLDGVRVGPSPDWLCRRLIAAGQRPINNIVDITNYVLLETGHPLHAFDYDKLAENRIVVRCARPGESITTLDGAARKLTPDMLVIADAKAPQAVAGVMGGADSEVGEGASRIFLESAYFNPVSIRRTSRALGLITEASQHFQRGADPEMAVYAINRAAMLIQELAGARIAPGLLDAYPKPYVAPTIPLRYSRTNALLGTDIDGDTQRNMLQRLGFGINNITDGSCDCTAPTWRPDVEQEADLIEEIARLHGYDKIPVTLPQVRQSEMAFAPHESKLRKLRRLLVDIGLTELVNWTFSSKENVQRAKLSAEYLDMVALQNPLSENHATMRSSLIPGLLANAAFNLNHGVDRMAAFELGPVYKPFGNNDLPDERVCMGVILIGPREEPHWSKSPQPYDFYDLKGFAEAILDFFDEALNLYEKDL